MELSRIRAGVKKALPTSFFWRYFKKESYVPDLYSESRVINTFIRPGYFWLRSHFSFSYLLPQMGVGLIILMCALYNPLVSYTHLAKFRLALLLIPMALIMGIVRSEVAFPKPTIFDLPLFFLFLTALISLRTVQDIQALFFGLRELMSLGLFIMSIYLGFYIFSKREIKRLFCLLSLSGLGASLIFIFCLLSFRSGEIYLKNTFGNPNHLAYFLLLIYPLPLALASDNSRTNYLWNAGGILIIFAMFFTFSMGAWISFFLSIPLLALALRKKWLLGLLTIVLATLIFFPFFRHKFLEGFSTGYGSTIMARIEVWKEALRSICQRPILGIGLGQFSASAKPYYMPQMYNAFNAFFHLAAVTGLFGLVSFLWFLTRAFKLNMSVLAKGREEKLYGGAVLTSLSAGVLCFLWDTHLLAVMTNWLLGLLFGSLVVMARKEGN